MVDQQQRWLEEHGRCNQQRVAAAAAAAAATWVSSPPSVVAIHIGCQ
jgi:hypothetical protein